MSTNDFVPFCNENTGTNLPTQSAYLANANLPIGNQPGIASSSLNNKATRQATTIAAVVAQYVVNQLAVNMLDAQNSNDHAVPTALLAALTGALKYHSPVYTTYTSGSGNHNLTYKFQIATGNATAAATYSDGTTTYTVSTTVASGTQLNATGNADPVATAGTLTKVTGTGDSTLTYYCYRKPIVVIARGVGGGGGGGATGTASATAGGSGGSTTFGTFSAGGGGGGTTGTGGSSGTGGIGGVTSGSPTVGLTGAQGRDAVFIAGTPAANTLGGDGAYSPLGGAGKGQRGAAGIAAVTNTGAGGGAAGGNGSVFPGGGGGAGAYMEAYIPSPASTYAYAVGAAGAAGSAGTSGFAGAAGASGILTVEERYQ